MRYDDDKGKKTGIIEERIIQPSTLEIIDQSMFDWVDEKLNIFCDTNKGWKKTPVLWITAERSHQIKHSQELRDQKGSIILPIITIERASMNKNPANKGIFYGNIPPSAQGGSITVSKRINPDKTSNFARADAYRKHKQINFPIENKKVVYQTMTIPMPTYVEIMYNIVLKSEYQQQMNQMAQPFFTKPGGINHFLLERDGHQYEGFIEGDFNQDNNISNLAEDERMYQTTVSIKVLGYLIGEDKNEANPKVIIRENAVEVKMPRERVIYGDIPDHIGKKGFYRD